MLATVLTPWEAAAARPDRLGSARPEPAGHTSGRAAAAADARERHGLDHRPVAVRRVSTACQHRALRPVRRSRGRDAGDRDHWHGHADHIGGRLRRRAPWRHRAAERQADRADQHPVGRPRRSAWSCRTSIRPDPTRDWDELAFSDARGWPVSVSFHQDRMVIGGSRDLPSGLWLSKTGDPFQLRSRHRAGRRGDRLSPRRQRRSGDPQPGVRAANLQVFTSVGEWVVTGDRR